MLSSFCGGQSLTDDVTTVVLAATP